MESNLLEIKRFLKDYKKNIFIGSIIISILFTISLFFLDTLKAEVPKDGQDNFEPTAEEILDDAQPAYFQIFVEREDGTAYGNPYIINQYFNLDSVKEKAEKTTGIDIKSVEEEVYLNKLNEEIKVINVVRNEDSYLLTAYFNLGNERNNLTLAEYYYNVLFSNEFSILQDKKVYIFEEPQIVQKNEAELTLEKREEEKIEEYSGLTNILKQSKNLITGLIFGIVTMIGFALLKVIFGKTLDYAFGYEIEENDRFILSDDRLNNQDLVTQFLAMPLQGQKVILSEKNINPKIKHRLTQNNFLTFDKNQKEKVILKQMNSLSEITRDTIISELIILIIPETTTRKWYQEQIQFAEINELTVKIIQMNVNG